MLRVPDLILKSPWLRWSAFAKSMGECRHTATDFYLLSGSGRSPGKGNGNSLQYSCLENAMDRGAWWATVHRVTKSWTRLSDLTFTFFSFSQQYVAVRKPAFPSRVRKGYEQSNEFRRIQKLTLPGPTLLSSQWGNRGLKKISLCKVSQLVCGCAKNPEVVAPTSHSPKWTRQKKKQGSQPDWFILIFPSAFLSPSSLSLHWQRWSSSAQIPSPEPPFLFHFAPLGPKTGRQNWVGKFSQQSSVTIYGG